MDVIQAVQWTPAGDAVRIIDQRQLPGAYVERDLRTVEEVCEAIRTLSVRGAPAIGICGAMGLVAALEVDADLSLEAFRACAAAAARRIAAARPTAVNLPWAMERMARTAGLPATSVHELLTRLRAEASAILAEDRAMCDAIGAHGLALVPDGARVLTHCNAGALATGGIGTALAPLYCAVARGRRVQVLADETRPLLQGARLTAWELTRAGIEVTVIADGAAASLMRAGAIDLCLVGADRIAANGDVANKIGTYAVAIAARHHGIPLYVAAPSSTIDPCAADGSAIVIEERGREELAMANGRVVVPAGALVRNPAFDLTPASLVTAIVTEAGVWRAPYRFGASSGAPPPG
jgi:methylthioribose-1-phosphate isomerase